MRIWERPAPRLLAVFVVLGLFGWWVFRAVSLSPSVRNLFEEDQAVAWAAKSVAQEERLAQEIQKLPAPSEDHAPEVAALLKRLQDLPPVPYLVQIARQRDAAVREGEATRPWDGAEQTAIDRMSESYLKAWEPFFQCPSIPWDQYPDSIRLFRCSLSRILDTPSGYNFSSLFLLFPDLNLFKPLRQLGALRFGTDFLLQNGWAALDTVALAENTRIFFLDSAQSSDLLFELSAPPPPQIEDIRMGLRSDRALFLSAAQYLESLPPDTSATIALQRFLGNKDHADWFLKRVPEIKTVNRLAQYLRQDADQILNLESKTFLPAPAWRQWLEGENTALGLSPTLQDSLQGLRDFEKIRLSYQVSMALCQALKNVQNGDVTRAREIADPAQPGAFLLIEESERGLIISSALPLLGNPTTRTSIVFPPPYARGSDH